jgi:hypothetical protein
MAVSKQHTSPGWTDLVGRAYSRTLTGRRGARGSFGIPELGRVSPTNDQFGASATPESNGFLAGEQVRGGAVLRATGD